MYFIWEGAEKVFPLRRIWEGFYWCRTYTPFEKELRRYFHLRRLNIFQHFDLRRHWEGFPFEKDLRSMELLQSSWDGFEKVRWIWEGNVPSLLETIWYRVGTKPDKGQFKLYHNTPNIFPILGVFFVNNVDCQSNHFCKTYNKAKCYEKSQIFNLW